MKLNTAEVALVQPDFLGFIFWGKSARFFEGEIPALPHQISKIGVFVDAELEFILETVLQHNLQGVQLHGNESPAYCEKITTALKNVNHKSDLIKVFSIKDDFNFDALKSYEHVCDYYLFDTKGKLPGGNGYVFDWSVLKAYPSTKPYFLSGGIGLENLDKIKDFMELPESEYCFAIDVNSKFELEPGLKKIDELKEFKKVVSDN